MPSLTRSGRPSVSFFSRPPCGQQVDVVAGKGGDVAHGAGDSTGAATAAANARWRSTTSPASPAAAETPPAITSVAARPERRDERSARGERDELGRVAEPVVGRERAPVPLRRHALVDQRAEGDVLDAVAGAADEVADDHEPEHEPERREDLPSPWIATAREGGDGERGDRDPGREEVRGEQHADRPARQDDADAVVLDAEHVLDVDEVGRDRRRHEEERRRCDRHREREQRGLRTGSAMPSRARRRSRRASAPGCRRTRSVSGDGGDGDERSRRRRASRAGRPRPPSGRRRRAARPRTRCTGPSRRSRSPTGCSGLPRRGHERELGRLRDRDAGAEHGREEQQERRTAS